MSCELVKKTKDATKNTDVAAMCWKFRKFKGHGSIISEITLHYFPVATYILQSHGMKSQKAGMFLRS